MKEDDGLAEHPQNAWDIKHLSREKKTRFKQNSIQEYEIPEVQKWTN